MIRPKSIATVVWALTERVSSVTSCSVDSTVISLMVRISVVLPAADGPVTTILTAVLPDWPRPVSRAVDGGISHPLDGGDEPQQQALVQRGVALDQAPARRRGHRLGVPTGGVVGIVLGGRRWR